MLLINSGVVCCSSAIQTAFFLAQQSTICGFLVVAFICGMLTMGALLIL